MQNRYVGDVGDFAKYGLLRRLVGTPDENPVRIGVVWCLFPDETHNNDGRHISYLQRTDFGGLDDPLLSALRQLVASGSRSVSAVGAAGLFPSGTVFCDEAAPARGAVGVSRDSLTSFRSDWLRRCLIATNRCELVFFDPDNGLEVASVAKHHRNSGKYVYWDELKPFWDRGQILLVYHHLNRTMPAAQQVRDLRDRFRTKLPEARVLPLTFRRGSCRIFWLVYRDSPMGAEIERRAKDFLSRGWAKHFRPVDWPDETQTAAHADAR